MRPVLALALVLLALTLALNHARTLFPEARPDGFLADRALELVVGAKGPMLPAGRLGGGSETIGEEIRVGLRTFVADGRPGLRSVRVAPDGSPRSVGVHDLSAGAGAALLEEVRGARPGEVLLLASSGRLQPADGRAPGPELERALARLGARANPGTATPESWALIALRGERGWIPLAEGYSRDSGVALAFVLGGERALPADFQGDRVMVRAPERRVVTLAQELASASARTPGVVPAVNRTVLGRRIDGLCLAPVADGEPACLEWRDVELHEGSAVSAWLGLADDASAGSDGATCAVRVDGALVARQALVPGAPWKHLLADLRPFAGRRVTLELVVEPGTSAQGDSVLWGLPALLHGYDGSPLERWARER